MRKIIFLCSLTVITLLMVVIIYKFTGDTKKIFYDRAIQYNSKSINEKIKKELELQKIPFNVNKNGIILYQSKQENKVNKITQKYEKESAVESPNISFTNSKQKEKLIKMLNEKKKRGDQKKLRGKVSGSGE